MRKIRFTSTRSRARTFSRSVQSMVTLLLHSPGQFPGNGAQGFVAEHLDRAVIGLQGIVEGQLVFREPEFFAAGVGFAHFPGELGQFLDHLRGFSTTRF